MVIAHVYLRGGSPQRVIKTTAGREVRFVGGHAEVHDPRDMTYVLRIPNAQVVVDKRWADWAPSWIEACGPFLPAVAEIVTPRGRYEKAGDSYVFVPLEETDDAQDGPAARKRAR